MVFAYFFFSELTMRICAVSGCSNSMYTLEKSKSTQCNIHEVTQGSSGCDCKPPFVLYTFPTGKRNPEARKEWVRLINRKDVKTGKLWPPTYDDRVCSKHFTDNEKSDACPNPCINLGYKKEIKRRKPPKERQAIEPKPETEDDIEMNTIGDPPICKWDHSSYTYNCDCCSDCQCIGCVDKEKKIKSLMKMLI